MTAFFLIILEILMVLTRVILGYFGRVKIIQMLITPMTWICVILGVIAGVFLILKIANEISKIVKRHTRDDDKKE